MVAEEFAFRPEKQPNKCRNRQSIDSESAFLKREPISVSGKNYLCRTRTRFFLSLSALTVLLTVDQLFPAMELPVIDIEPYLHASATFGNAANVEEQQKLLEDLVSQSACLSNLCSEVSRSLKETGTLVIKDPRCSIDDNDRFLDMMEKYFEMPDEFKRLQARPTLHYQVRRILFFFCAL